MSIFFSKIIDFEKNPSNVFFLNTINRTAILSFFSPLLAIGRICSKPGMSNCILYVEYNWLWGQKHSKLEYWRSRRIFTGIILIDSGSIMVFMISPFWQVLHRVSTAGQVKPVYYGQWDSFHNFPKFVWTSHFLIVLLRQNLTAVALISLIWAFENCCRVLNFELLVLTSRNSKVSKLLSEENQSRLKKPVFVSFRTALLYEENNMRY